jgi:hydroxypyruvate isomerase
MTLRFSPNLSLMWTELPLGGRFAAAAAAGFDHVELWWPGDEAAATLPELCRRYGLRLALLNVDAGDMPAGDRGLAADPARRDQLRRNVPEALRIATACGAARLNLLLGLRLPEHSLEDQLGWAAENVAWAADQAAPLGCEVMVEAVNPAENGPYLVTTTGAAAAFIERVGRPNVKLQYDAYHMQRTEGNLTLTLDAHWPLIGHIQIADVPGRGEPGTGEINYRFVLDHLDRKGYTGHVGLEYRPSTPATEDSLGWLDSYRDNS